MKSLKVVFLICLVFSFEIFSQSLSIGLGSGLNFINGGNYFTDNLGRIGIYQNKNGTNTTFEGLSLDNEIQFQLGAKYSLEDFPINLLLNVQYLRMRGTESMNIYDNFLGREFLYDVTTKLDIWSLQVGSSYSYYFYSLKPFITASVLFNYFDDVYVELAQDRHLSEYPDYENGMRYGYSLGLGVSYNIFNNIELELLSRYNDLNFLNRRDGEVKLASTSLLLGIYYKVF
jgi:opacity protein-like surface antigen